MPPSVVLLTRPGSPLGDALSPRVDAHGGVCRTLNLDAPLSAEPVTVRPRGVAWQGVDLLGTGAILVERPVFPWPQPVRLRDLPGDAGDRRAAAGAEREARSLAVSALRVAAEVRPVVNPPEAGHLAASPAVGLDRARGAGVPVAPWRLAPAGSADPEAGDLVQDVVGGERWHAPSPPAGGDPTLILTPAGGAVSTLLIVGEAVAVAVEHPSPAAWTGGGPASGALLASPGPGAAAAALAAARACALPLAAVTVDGHTTESVLYIDAAPDLTAWGSVTQGRALDALAAYLVHLAGLPDRVPPPPEGGP